jgi:hypothetical protein
MAFGNGPKIVTDGLVFALDASDQNSYISGSLTWKDLSGNGNTGTLTNGPTYSSTNGGSVVFDGIDDYVDISTSPNLTNPLTICTFVNKSFITGSDQIIYGPSANGNDNWLSVYSNRVQVFATQTADVNNFTIQSNTVITANKWYYITVIVNDNVISLYVNGVFDVASSPQAFTIAGWNSTARIGQRPTGQFIFNGSIANVHGYNRALSATEVLQNYNALKSRFNLK